MIQGAGSQVPLLIRADALAGAALSLVVPFDTTAPGRLAAASRFWRIYHGLPAPDQRLTPERRRRLRQMLRASDGQASGASHRDIALALFGVRRMAAELWPDSSLRYATQRLLQGARGMISQGYLDLLQHRRRV